jgi:hypothetical protein
MGFVLPGVDVVKDQACGNTFETPSPGGVPSRVVFKYETESSVATASVAGPAAMVINWVKAIAMALKAAKQKSIGITHSRAIKIAEHDAMQLAFVSLDRVMTNNFIQLWDNTKLKSV